MTRLFFCLLCAAPGLAQDAEPEVPLEPDQAADIAKAQALVNVAVGHFRAKNFEAALEPLMQAERIAVRANDPALASIRFNVARCLEELERWPDAIAAYEAYLELPDDSHRKARAWKAVKVIEARAYGRLQVLCMPEGARVTIAERSDAPKVCPVRLERVKPGTYHVSASHPGHVKAERTVVVAAGLDQRVEMRLARQVVADAAIEARQPVAPAEANPWPWVVIGVGVAAVAGGGAATGSAMDSRTEAEGLPPGSARDDAVSSFELGRTMSYTAYGVGAAAIVGGVLWWVFDEPAVEPAAGGVAFRW